MQIEKELKGLKEIACWEVIKVKTSNNPNVVFVFDVLINGEHKYHGSAMRNNVIIMQPCTLDGMSFVIEANEDHAVKRDLASIGYTIPNINCI